MHDASPELIAALRGYVFRRRAVEAARGLLEGIAGGALLLCLLRLAGVPEQMALSSDRAVLHLALATELFSTLLWRSGCSSQPR